MKRYQVELPNTEELRLAEYVRAGTARHEALADLVPDVAVDSVASAVRALALVGLGVLEEERLRREYDAAIENGEFDGEAVAWCRATATVLLR